MDSSGSEYDGMDDYLSSESSTPGSPRAHYEPKFRVKVIDPTKNGDCVLFTIITKNAGGDEKLVERLYDDFDYLHHCLITHADNAGVVIPPLPGKPIVEAKGAAEKSKQQLGNSKAVMGDELTLDCRRLEKYLSLLVGHHLLGGLSYLEEFLLRDQAPVRANVRRGMFGKLSHAVEEARKASHKDIDDYFQKERDKANDFCARMKDVTNCFTKRTASEHKIASVYGHLATTLTMGSGRQDKYGAHCNKIFIKMSEALEDAKHGSEVDVKNNENLLGFHLDLYSRYSDALKETLYRRTCLLIGYEESNRALAKAKPTKLSAAEEAKHQAEQAFEDCSELLRRELVAYQRQKILAFQQALTLYAEAKVKTATDTCALLAKSIASIKQMPVDL